MPGKHVVRVAVFNSALSREGEGELALALSGRGDGKARLVAEVLQRTRPDVVVLQEFDYDASGRSVQDFMSNYLAVSQNGAEPIGYAHFFMPEVNTGVPVRDGAGELLDVNGDGLVGTPGDAHGWGNYPGHYGMVVLSRWPLEEVVSWRERLWSEVEETRETWVPPAGIIRPWQRLSSKTHAVIRTDLSETLSLALLVAHPTPPVFDGPEDRNGWRNAGEIRMLARMVGAWRERGGENSERFVLLGDLNADPEDGDSRWDVLGRLPSLMGWTDYEPSSAGGVAWSAEQGGVNAGHRTRPELDTADWPDEEGGPGNLRVDYVLPSRALDVMGSGVFWPGPGHPLAYLNESSDHRLVWVDVVLPAE
ncbi:MAG: endonuclease/exonuclease/phosphatase family protein [Planctomycetota bacterium]